MEVHKTFKSTESRDVEVEFDSLAEVIFGMKMENHHLAYILAFLDSIKNLDQWFALTISEARAVPRELRFRHVRTTKSSCTNCSGSGYIES